MNDALDIPFVAIGGINDHNIQNVMKFSPHMVGVIRSYQSTQEWQALFDV